MINGSETRSIKFERMSLVPVFTAAKLIEGAKPWPTEPAPRQRFTGLALEIPAPEQQTPEAPAVHHRVQIERWWPVIKGAGVTPQ
jgi:hypothetical protein